MCAHPLADWAYQLVVLHERSVPTVVEGNEIGCERVDLIRTIDTWTKRQAPQHRNGSALHTESLGSVVDRIAAAHVHAVHMLMTRPVAHACVHAAWHHLAELTDAYTDLVTEVCNGHRRLPDLDHLLR
ncbi:DUF4254 domain-containing protein [Nocardia terpenica]|uniref:DUF4254 domain-containing protein n=1 Tax=Nocardia terpenica TaxID=455432 RepID=A0A291RW80_9NOCA|nr:hypothetical protein CRH09_03285 [Nocardia terpenica]